MFNTKTILFFVLAVVVSTSNAIIDGQNSYPGQHPYFVYVRPSADRVGFGIGGGTLISHCWVICVAHIVEDASVVELGLGTVLRDANDLTQPTPIFQLLERDRIHIHPSYNKTLILK